MSDHTEELRRRLAESPVLRLDPGLYRCEMQGRPGIELNQWQSYTIRGAGIDQTTVLLDTVEHGRSLFLAGHDTDVELSDLTLRCRNGAGFDKHHTFGVAHYGGGTVRCERVRLSMFSDAIKISDGQPTDVVLRDCELDAISQCLLHVGRDHQTISISGCRFGPTGQTEKDHHLYLMEGTDLVVTDSLFEEAVGRSIAMFSDYTLDDDLPPSLYHVTGCRFRVLHQDALLLSTRPGCWCVVVGNVIGSAGSGIAIRRTSGVIRDNLIRARKFGVFNLPAAGQFAAAAASLRITGNRFELEQYASSALYFSNPAAGQLACFEDNQVQADKGPPGSIAIVRALASCQTRIARTSAVGRFGRAYELTDGVHVLGPDAGAIFCATRLITRPPAVVHET